MPRKLPSVAEEIKKHYQESIRTWPVRSLQASQLGDPCERYLYHSFMDWERKKPIDSRTQGLFNLGRHLESLGAEYLEKTGWEVFKHMDKFDWREKHITGYADRFISRADVSIKKIPVEIKWLMDEDVGTWQEMIRSDKRWIRRYPAQLTIYMLLRSCELGLFLSYSKMSGAPHSIWFDFDDDDLIEFGEATLAKCERVWSCIEAQTPAVRINPSEGICIDCDFLNVCLPPMWFGPEALEIGEGRITQLLEQKEKLKPSWSECEKVEKEIKKILGAYFSAQPEGKPQSAFCGNWIISGKLIQKAGEEKPRGPSEYWKYTFKKIEQKPEPYGEDF